MRDGPVNTSNAAVEVHLYGGFRGLAGSSSGVQDDAVVLMELHEGATVHDVFLRLGIDPREVSHVFVNAQYSSPQREVKGGDRLGIFPRNMAVLYRQYFDRKGPDDESAGWKSLANEGPEDEERGRGGGVQIELRLFASLRDKYPDMPGSGGQGLSMTLSEGTSVARLLDRLNIGLDVAKLVYINGRMKGKDYVIVDGDRVSIFPPIAGG